MDVTHSGALGYFINNSRVVVTLALGALSFGTIGFFNLFINGVILGAIIEIWYRELTASFVLLSLLPHGIFELPALWIAGAVGFKLPREFFRYLFGRKEHFIDRHDLTAMVTLLLVSLTLIGIAAVIEAHVTPTFVAGYG